MKSLVMFQVHMLLSRTSRTHSTRLLTINFSIPVEGFVILDVYNSIGQKVATLVNETKTAGTYAVDFDASDLTSGIYFYKISSGNFSETKKMILLK